MVAKAENGHANIKELFKLNFVATYNIRSAEKDSEKNMVLCQKGDDITPFDGSRIRIRIRIQVKCLTWIRIRIKEKV